MMKKKYLKLAAGVLSCALLLTGCSNSGNSTKMTNYSQYVTLGEYKGIEYTPASVEVTDEEIQAEVDYFLQQLGDTEELKEGTVKDGDTINLDYIGYVDGEAFEGGSTDGAGTQLTIGSHAYIDDFEEQLIGHEVGEEGIEVNVTFPDDYKNQDNTISDLAGKDATFVCTINSIYQTTYPEELTDELVAANTKYDTVNSFMDGLKMDYENYKQQQADKQAKADVIMKVIENATFSGYPEDEIQELTEKTVQGAKDSAESYSMEYEDYLALMKDADGNAYTSDSYKQAAEDYIHELMEEKMVVCQIAKQEGIKASKQEVDDYVQEECANNTSLSADTMYEQYSMSELAYAVVYDKVTDFLMQNAVAISK